MFRTSALIASFLFALPFRAIAQPEVIAPLVKSLTPALVQLRTTSPAEGDALRADRPVLTGTIIDAERGLVLTSSYSLTPDPPAAITLTDSAGQLHAAKLLAIDHHRRLALLQCDGELPPAKLRYANPREVQPGQTAIALGWVYAEQPGNVSVGIVSAVHRLGGKALQTDAACSPANYGGVLVNLRGEVLGIIAPLAPEFAAENAVSWYDSGIGFAVAAEQFLPRIEKMQSGNAIHAGLLPVALRSGSPLTTSGKIANAAKDVGLSQGDTIVGVAGQPVSSQWELLHKLGAMDAGSKVSLEVEANGEQRTVEVTLQEKPLEESNLSP